MGEKSPFVVSRAGNLAICNMCKSSPPGAPQLGDVRRDPPRLTSGDELAPVYGSLCLASSAINWMKLSTGLIFWRSELL